MPSKVQSDYHSMYAEFKVPWVHWAFPGMVSHHKITLSKPIVVTSPHPHLLLAMMLKIYIMSCTSTPVSMIILDYAHNVENDQKWYRNCHICQLVSRYTGWLLVKISLAIFSRSCFSFGVYTQSSWSRFILTQYRSMMDGWMDRQPDRYRHTMTAHITWWKRV